MRALKSVRSEGKGLSSVRIHPDILKVARAAAADRGISLDDIIGEALQDYLT